MEECRLRALIESWGVEETIAHHGGFDLWCTEDGDRFTPVTRGGFGNPFNCGARTLVSTPYGLAVGTVNPFGPEVAQQVDGKWDYVPNVRGGAEVWLGNPELPQHFQ